jgi:hypothetical protein
MSKAKFGFLVFAVIVSGLIGGLFSGRILVPQVALAQGSAKVIEAGEIRIVDKDGKSRAVLALGEGGEPGLKFYDIYGKVRASLELGAYDVPSLILYEQGEIKRATFQGKKGEPFLIMHDSTGNPAFSFVSTVSYQAGVNHIENGKWVTGTIWLK